MQWVQFWLRNRLALYAATLLVCLLGLFFVVMMPISPMPELPFNKIAISFNYPGANAQTVQQQITTKVTNALQSVSNVHQITGVSQAGSSTIDLLLNSIKQNKLLKTELDIMQAIASSNLPSTVGQPSVQLISGGSGLISFVVTSKALTEFEIDNFIHAVLYPKFSALPGVLLQAPDNPAVVRISLNPELLAQNHLSANSISQLIDQSIQSQPLGAMYINKESYQLNFKKQFDSVKTLKNLIIGYNQNATGSGEPIYLKNVAKVSFEPQYIIPQDYFSYNGKPAGTISLYTQEQANPFIISKKSRDYIANLLKSLPTSIHITPIFDMAKVMSASVHEVVFTILIASILVLLIALMFLGSFRATLIPIITIPVCLLGTIVVLKLFGYGINFISLLAMVIAVGLVVDDAIVVVENITRHLEMGKSKADAVIHGTTDIAFTIIGITATLLAVYLPISFYQGDIAPMLKAFTFTLAIAVFLSGIVALTLTPVMAMVFLGSRAQNPYQRKFNAILHRIVNVYHRFLNRILSAPKISLIGIVVLISVGIFFCMRLSADVFPVDPSGQVSISITASPLDTVTTLKHTMDRFQKFYTQKSVAYYSKDVSKNSETGVLTATVQLQYKPAYLHQNIAYVNQINRFIKQQHIQNASAQVDKFFNWGNGYDVSFYLYGGSDNNKLNQTASRISHAMRKSKLFRVVIDAINQPQKQLAFVVDHVAAAKLGIYQNTLANFLSVYYGGFTLDNYFSIDGLTVPVMIQLEQNGLTNPNSYQDLQIQSPKDNKFYPVTDFTSVKTVAKPKMITTMNNQPAVLIQANLTKGVTMQRAIDEINSLMQSDGNNFQYQYTGLAKTYLEGNHDTIFIGLFGVLSVYFLLTVLFRNLIDPFIIMLTVPFTIVGGLLSLYLIHGSINLFSALALLTLIGLITKHGILIVQFANHEYAKGLSVTEALHVATQQRFRPIIMTTLAMTLGALPLVFSNDIMYVSRRSLGVPLISGLLIGTLFSLFIVPLVYALVKPNQKIIQS